MERVFYLRVRPEGGGPAVEFVQIHGIHGIHRDEGEDDHTCPPVRSLEEQLRAATATFIRGGIIVGDLNQPRHLQALPACGAHLQR